MKIFLVILSTGSLFLFSCQKERDFANRNNGGNGGNSAAGLLVKMVQKTGSDSIVTTYGYDANKKIINLKRIGTDQGSPVNAEYRFYRNSSGILTYYSIVDADLVAAGIDSLVTIVHYNSSASRYTSYVLNVNIPGFILLDSSVFVYDGSGKIIEEDAYQSPSGLGNDYYLTGRINYTYSAGGNLSQLDIHDLDQSGTETFSATTKVDCDAKTNPLHFDNEAFPMGHPEWISPNNIAGEQLSDSNGPADDQAVTMSYSYNSDNKPETNVTTVVPDNTTTNTSFYYQ